MLQSLSILTIIAIVADLISIGSFLHSILIEKNFNKILNKVLIIVIFFLLAIFTYFFTPHIIYGIDINLLLHIAGILYLIFSALGIAIISYIYYSSSYTIIEYIINAISIIVPLFLGISLFWLIQKPLDFFASVLLYVSFFHFSLMARNYIYSKFSDSLEKESGVVKSESKNEDKSIIDKLKDKFTILKGTRAMKPLSFKSFLGAKIIHNGFNFKEFWLECCFGFIPVLMGFSILIGTNEVYRNRFYEAVRFENNSWILTRDTTNSSIIKKRADFVSLDEKRDTFLDLDKEKIVYDLFSYLNNRDKKGLETLLENQLTNFWDWQNIEKSRLLIELEATHWLPLESENYDILSPISQEQDTLKETTTLFFKAKYENFKDGVKKTENQDVEVIINDKGKIFSYSVSLNE